MLSRLALLDFDKDHLCAIAHNQINFAALPAPAQDAGPPQGPVTPLSIQQQAALKFMRWITSPERAAQWGIDTGYVAVRPDAFETPANASILFGLMAVIGLAPPPWVQRHNEWLLLVLALPSMSAAVNGWIAAE